MAWDDELPVILRDLMQDYATTPLYTDDRYNQLVLTSTIIIQREVAFANLYVADVVNVTLKPDPTKLIPVDYDFINLVCLRSAVNLTRAEIRDLTRQGIEIQDGSSRLKLQRDSRSLDLMLKAYEDQYDKALYAYKTGGNTGLGEAVVSPYPYLAEWPFGMASMYEGYPTGRFDRHNIGGLY